jgi:hypothetical protein
MDSTAPQRPTRPSALQLLQLAKRNKQFRHIAPKLDIVSFYETQPASIGLKSLRVVGRSGYAIYFLQFYLCPKMVLEKDSSILGYPGDTSKALGADHHRICK